MEPLIHCRSKKQKKYHAEYYHGPTKVCQPKSTKCSLAGQQLSGNCPMPTCVLRTTRNRVPQKRVIKGGGVFGPRFMIGKTAILHFTGKK